MAEFRIWLPDYGETEFLYETTVQADSPREAAESLGDDLGDGESIIVAVRAPDGSLTEWRVSAFLRIESSRYRRG